MENAISFNTLAPTSKTRNSLQRSSESMKKTCAKNDVSASTHIYTYSYIVTRLCAVIHNIVMVWGSVFRALVYLRKGCGFLGVRVVVFAPICSFGNEPLFL
jgi:hypothetical protein